MLVGSGMAMGLAGTRGSVVVGVAFVFVLLLPVAEATAQAITRTVTAIPTDTTTRRRRKSAAEGISPSCQEKFQPIHAPSDDGVLSGAAAGQPPAELAGAEQYC